MEYQINAPTSFMSFMRFLNLSLEEKVPDTKTIWAYREKLVQNDVMKTLFDMFEASLELQGIIKHEGTIVDATFVDAPRQRNSKKENKLIKEGEIPEEWKENTPKA